MRRITRLQIEGFKSFRKLDVELNPGVNVLIGANGSGKSNLVDFFRMLGAMGRHTFQRFVSENGGADRLCHLGTKETTSIKCAVGFREQQDRARYAFELVVTNDDRLLFGSEEFGNDTSHQGFEKVHTPGGGAEPSYNQTWQMPGGPEPPQSQAILRWIVAMIEAYRLDDIGPTSPIRKPQATSDRLWLRSDFSNLSPMIGFHSVSGAPEHARLVELTKRVCPSFDGFRFVSIEDGARLRFEWEHKTRDFPMHNSQLSGGTLRFIAMAWALIHPGYRSLQDMEFGEQGIVVKHFATARPDIIVLDEPELGLHPHALELLASLIKSVATERQVIIATQSVDLLNQFSPEEVIVMDSDGAQSTAHRLDPKALEDWLKEYSLGDLWWKNVFGGGT